jgi:hypothetical protein
MQANNSMVNQGYHPQRQAYPYTGGHSDVQPGVYSAGNSGYPPNYGQMSYNGDAAMFKYGGLKGKVQGEAQCFRLRVDDDC